MWRWWRAPQELVSERAAETANRVRGDAWRLLADPFAVLLLLHAQVNL